MSYSYDSGPSAGEIIYRIIIGGGVIFLIGSAAVELKSCTSKLASNRDNIDLEKTFNIALEKNGKNISIINITNYTDFTGDTIEFVTRDGLRVVTSTQNTSLINNNKYQSIYNYALSLVNGEEDKIISYDELVGRTVLLNQDGWNKDYFNFEYSFDKALVKGNDGGITILDIETWKDWDEDDKIQFITSDGLTVLDQYKNVNLINTEESSVDALYYYALSLTGNDESKVHDYTKSKIKTR